MKYSREVLADWLDRIENEASGLTAWESSFVVSLADQMDQGRNLSERQVEILERIYVEKVP